MIKNTSYTIIDVLWPRLLATIKLTLSSQAAAAADTCVLHVPVHTSGLTVLRYAKHNSSIASLAIMHVVPVPQS